MKYIFRYSLLSNFPNKDNKITHEQLSQALQSVNFDFNKFDLNHLENLCLNCVQKFFTRPQEKVITVIENVFSSATKPVPDFNAKELENIWQQQKVNIYKSILSSSCKSSLTFKEMQWSVKNIIMRRSQSGRKGDNIITRMKLKCVENFECQQKVQLVINVSKKGFERMYNSLQECENAINQVLFSQ